MVYASALWSIWKGINGVSRAVCGAIYAIYLATHGDDAERLGRAVPSETYGYVLRLPSEAGAGKPEVRLMGDGWLLLSEILLVRWPELEESLPFFFLCLFCFDGIYGWERWLI